MPFIRKGRLKYEGKPIKDGGFILEKENDNTELTKNSRNNEEELEVSSTGYGLESVSKTEEEQTTTNKDTPCGGL
jgi:hypothetical protein